MGLTYIEGTVKPTGRRRQAKRVRFLVDSGAVYSVLRRADWQALGLKPERQLEFVLADGTTLTRGVSESPAHALAPRAGGAGAGGRR